MDKKVEFQAEYSVAYERKMASIKEQKEHELLCRLDQGDRLAQRQRQDKLLKDAQKVVRERIRDMKMRSEFQLYCALKS